MSTNEIEWIDGEQAHVFWREDMPDISWMSTGQCMIRIQNGVQEMREKQVDAVHYFAPDTWLRIGVTETGQGAVLGSDPSATISG
ncbi:hypothetical protein [Mycolicibacterium peregrinum]|nr:hypothetical protein [Mycolicibacterium peregrinum]